MREHIKKTPLPLLPQYSIDAFSLYGQEQTHPPHETKKAPLTVTTIKDALAFMLRIIHLRQAFVNPLFTIFSTGAEKIAFAA